MARFKDLPSSSEYPLDENDFVCSHGQEEKIFTSISIAEIKRMREMAFDRWTWETGDEKDKELFEHLDAVLESVAKTSSFSADDFYIPQVPIKT